jgi:hypothetical protein
MKSTAHLKQEIKPNKHGEICVTAAFQQAMHELHRMKFRGKELMPQ